MKPRSCTRRLALALPFLLAACASGGEQQNFPPLDFSFLTPLPLNVANIDIESHYMPSGVPPDVTRFDPIQPVAALQQMAEQRLKAVGPSGHAVFAIEDASMIQQADIITGAFSVTLNVYNEAGARAAFAQATVTRQTAGIDGDLPSALYALTREIMRQMNGEFEYQVRRSLGPWLVRASAVPSPVHQAPLEAGPPAAAPVPPPSAPGPAAPPPPPQAPGLPEPGPVID